MNRLKKKDPKADCKRIKETSLFDDDELATSRLKKERGLSESDAHVSQKPERKLITQPLF
jgi:hypothetical protein